MPLWLEITLGATGAFAAIASALAAWFALQLARREGEPVLVIYLECSQAGQTYLVIENLGRAPAYQLRVTPHSKLEKTSEQTGERIPIQWGVLASGLPVLHPGRKQFVHWGHRRAVNQDLIATANGVRIEYSIKPGQFPRLASHRSVSVALSVEMLPPVLEDGATVAGAIAGCKRALEALNQNLSKAEG